MSELQHAYYNAFCALVSDMQDYKRHGSWLKEAISPILPIKEQTLIERDEPILSPKWEADGCRWEAPDFYPYIINGLIFLKSISIPIEVFRSKNGERLRAIMLKTLQELHGRKAYFSLEKELVKNDYSLLIFIERDIYANELFAKAIGRA